jgi:WD40 repeat protein
MITALTFSQDGDQLAIGDATGAIALWHLPDSMVQWQNLQAHRDRITALAFTSNGQRLYSGSRDRSIQGWTHQGHPLANLSRHRRRVHILRCANDDQTLYSGSYDGTVCSWRLSNHTLTQTWEQLDQYIHDVTFDAHHRPMVLISDTQTLKLWDLESAVCRLTFPRQSTTLWHVSTSLDGTALVCASQSGDVSLWSLSTGEFWGQLRVDRPYEGMQIHDCKGLTDSERQMLYSLGATEY